MSKILLKVVDFMHELSEQTLFLACFHKLRQKWVD